MECKRVGIVLMQVGVTILAFLAVLALNDWLFPALEFMPGIAWIYLPAGVRLLATLLFAEAGAIGLLLVSWLVSFVWFFPDDPQRAAIGGIVAALAPYLVYLGARYFFGLRRGFGELTLEQLLTLSVAYSVTSPLLHHLWFAAQGQRDVLPGFTVMFIGDLAGTLLVLAAVKAALLLRARRAR